MIDIKKMCAFITEELLFEPQVLGNDEELLLSGLLDSMAIAQLVVYIENELEVSIPPVDLRIENFRTVNCIAAYLENSLKV